MFNNFYVSHNTEATVLSGIWVGIAGFSLYTTV